MGALVLLSGGLDSTVALFWAVQHYGPAVDAISFDYRQRHADREIGAAMKIAKLRGVRHTIRSFGALHRTSELTKVTDGLPIATPEMSVVPARNTILLALAAAFAIGADRDTVLFGANADDAQYYPDCRPPFLAAMADVFEVAYSGLRLKAPLINKSKADVIRLARDLPGCWEAIALSWSCYEGGSVTCLQCPACKVRTRAFAEVGIVDPACA